MNIEQLPNYEPEPIPRFDAVIFDLDSTLVTIEGIDELAKFNGVIDLIAPLTQGAMNGTLSFEDIFKKRLEIIRPTYHDLIALGYRYRSTITKGAVEIIDYLIRNNVNVFIVSGGYNPSTQVLGEFLGIPKEHIFANELLFHEDGTYKEINEDIPLWKNTGKKDIISWLRQQYTGSFAMVGDSTGDMEAGTYTDQFIGFAGVINRPAMVEKAELVVTEPDLRTLIQYL